ncbi:MAG: glycerol-3-phosphate dehydrogenase subunit GlpB [Desulfobacterales bacterium]
MTPAREAPCDVAVIGSGLAGMSAAWFAARAGLSTILIGRTGGILFASGMIDLLAVHPLESQRLWDDPWGALAQLAADQPAHPLARIAPDRIRESLAAVTGTLAENGLAYLEAAARNRWVLTALGTFRPTFRVPLTMAAGVAAREAGVAARIVSFHGLRGFSARGIAACAGELWRGLKAATLSFPAAAPGSELFPERMARALETADARAALARALEPCREGVEAIGLPAVLGISRTDEVHRDLEARLGIPLFEIPTLPPGATGLRLQEAFERALDAAGVRRIPEQRVVRAEVRGGGFRLETENRDFSPPIEARGAILATGRFLGGGLRADRGRLGEALFGLPVVFPRERDGWHGKDFFQPGGHPLNRAGIETDHAFRPLGPGGEPFHPRLFAAGSLLAGQDWVRERCGAALSIATAHAAVEGLKRELA